MGKHTPTPWYVIPDAHTFSNGGIATVPNAQGSDGLLWSGYDDEMASQTDIEFIVRACYAHDDLVEQCEYLETVAQAMAAKEPRDVFDWKLVHERAHAALAKARS